jgi:hypothetical protein
MDDFVYATHAQGPGFQDTQSSIDQCDAIVFEREKAIQPCLMTEFSMASQDLAMQPFLKAEHRDRIFLPLPVDRE